MSISKSISFDEFNTLVKNIQKSIVDKLVREEGLDPTYVLVDVKVSKKGELLNLFATEIKSIVVTDEKPEVYRFDEPDVSGVFPCTNTNLMVIVHVSDVSYADNYLVLPEDTYTFNSYEDYLEFFTGKYKNVTESNHCTVQTVVNDARVGLATILTDVVETTCDVDRPLTNSDFTSLERYRTLPVFVQQKVDELTCPLVIENEAVFIDRLHGAVNIQLDKHDILEHVRCTDKFSGEINKLINDLPVR